MKQFWKRKKQPITKKRADSQHEMVLDRVVERVHSAYLFTLGTANAPDREQVRESISTILEWTHHPDYLDQDVFDLSYGALIRVDRRDRYWDNFQVFVPATANMIWYKEVGDGR